MTKSLTFTLFLLGAVATGVFGQDEFQRRATWQIPDVIQVKAQLDAWLDGQAVEEPARARVEAIWNQSSGADVAEPLLLRLAKCIAEVSPEARQLVQVCALPGGGESGSLVETQWLQGEEVGDLVRYNLRLLYGVWLAQQALYDEASVQLESLQPDQVVDPARLLFYQAVVHHRLLNRQPCLDAISRLLENKDRIPRRYASVAVLMEADIQPLKVDSLDEVARLMQDVQRRLQFRRAGKRVRDEEDTVIAKLDKMIEELQQQQQQQQMQAGGANQGSIRSNSPAQDSVPLGGRGQGDVDERDIGNASDWGNLPPKQRQEALQQISKDLPAHYRGVIEEYFRKLAQDGDER